MNHAVKAADPDIVDQRSWSRTLRQMVWVAWRQHQAVLISILAALSVLAFIMLGVGFRAHAQFAALPTCGGAKCALQPDMFNQKPFDSYPAIIGFALHAVPLLVGMFLGAPLLASEIEIGTFRFAWTQGTTRVRWTVAKLVLLAAVIAIATSALGIFAEWSIQPFTWLGMFNSWQPTLLDVSAVDLAGWTLLSFTFGALAGTLIKRTVPSMGVTLTAVTVVLGLAWWKGDNLLLGTGTATTRSAPYFTGNLTGALNQVAPPDSGVINGGWLTRGWFTGPHGGPPSAGAMRFLNMRMPGGSPVSQMQWLTNHHETYWVAYQPASRLWVFQGIYTCGLLLLALALGIATVWLVRRTAV